ncbi:hypothetical protein QVD17_28059 [Tagetes erecta]|uniref:Uncharacterized protein n=1 Tax=Tagetes erecta TaxID=13708 RepID=A0AAD8NS54_TARER|nr:hypothetical protein QVD17_28059 [Tagetes erecta]
MRQRKRKKREKQQQQRKIYRERTRQRRKRLRNFQLAKPNRSTNTITRSTHKTLTIHHIALFAPYFPHFDSTLTLKAGIYNVSCI